MTRTPPIRLSAPALALVLVGQGLAAAELPDGATLEREGARIGEVRILAKDIFDESNPGESSAPYRLANRLHIETRESTIRSQLLFAPGDVYSERLVAESARALRRQGYLSQSDIAPVAWHDGVVDIEVRSSDVWSTNPGISWSRAGGHNDFSFQLEEQNLFGRGKSLQLEYASNVDRSGASLQWRDPAVFGSRWTSSVALASRDDGQGWALAIDRPFYSMSTTWNAGVAASSDEHVQDRYSLGKIVDDYGVHQRAFDAHRGWSGGEHAGWTRRWIAGLRYDDARFTPTSTVPLGPLPADRTLAYPYGRFELLQDGYLTTRNVEQIGRTEDVQYGSQVVVELGASLPAMGGDEALVAMAHAGRGFRYRGDQSLFVDLSAGGRYEGAGLRDSLLSASARYYKRLGEHAMFYAALQGESGHALDLDHELELGGDTGLRGYPLRYQTGSSRVLGTVEARFYTDWYPLRLARVGAAVFADVGRIGGDSALDVPRLGTLRDVGFGLRLGNTRSALGNVLHLDIAFPLDRTPDIDSVQFLVKTHKSF